MKGFISCTIAVFMLALVSCTGIASNDVYFDDSILKTSGESGSVSADGLLVVNAKKDGTTVINAETIRAMYPGCDFSKVEIIVIENGITKIGEGTFADCFPKLQTVLFATSSLSEIGAGAFRNAVNLKSVTIVGTVRSIGKGAFAGCASLKNVKFDKTEGWFCDGVEADVSKSEFNGEALASGVWSAREMVRK